MALVPVPDPVDPVGLDEGYAPQDAPGEAFEPQKPKRGESARRWLLGAAGSQPAQPGKLSSSFQPQIVTPAPKSYGRDAPAIDVDENQSRSRMLRNSDTVDAEAAKLRCLNAWIRISKTLFEGNPDASEPERRRSLLARERFGLQKLALVRQAAARARAEVEALPVGDPGDRGAARARRDAARRADALEHRALEIDDRLCPITQEIDTAPRRAYDEIAAIIGHFRLAYEQRAEQDKDQVGIWRTLQAAAEHGSLDFGDVFGAPEVPSIAEIEALIKAARDRRAGGAPPEAIA